MMPSPLAILLACLVLLASAAATPCATAQSAAPPVTLANVYDRAAFDAHGDLHGDLDDYWVSEKYDGVRAWWNGRMLLTRTGNVIHAPGWFTAPLPETPLDGELWIGRGQFEAVSAAVRDKNPDDAAWRAVKFMVFDLPAHGGTFDERLASLNAMASDLGIAWVRPVAQFKVADQAELQAKLRTFVANGAEGLMLHRGDSLYRAGRSDDLLKLKPFDDAEARVIAHLPGNGKYRGLLGALLVERADGLQFRLGTGFTDAQRRDPPPIGSWVTYGYHGLTARGVPRFARFLRVRDDAPAGPTGDQ